MGGSITSVLATNHIHILSRPGCQDNAILTQIGQVFVGNTFWQVDALHIPQEVRYILQATRL